jgi:hypothetical protein
MSLVAIAALAVAVAADTPPAPTPDASGWTVARITVLYKREGPQSAGFALFTADPSSLGVIFRCETGRIAAMLSFEPVDLRDAISKRGNAQRLIGHLSFAGDEKVKTNFLAIPRLDIATPIEPSLSRRIYNAAARDEVITARIGGRKDLVYDFPAQFNEFRRSCEIGKAEAEPPPVGD